MDQKQEMYYFHGADVDSESIDKTEKLSVIEIVRISRCIINQPSSTEMDQSESPTIEISESSNWLKNNSSSDVEKPSAIKRKDSQLNIFEETVQMESVQHMEESAIVLNFGDSDISEFVKSTFNVFSPVSRRRGTSLWGDHEFWRSSTLAIDTENLFDWSFKGEILSSIKVDWFLILSFICGVGYEGRLTISKSFVILETIHHCPAGIVIAAFANSVYLITNLRRWQIFTIVLILVFYVDAVLLVNALYRHLMNCVVMSIYVLIVYVYCSEGFYVRARYVLLYVVIYSILCVVTVIMLHFKLWTAILLIFNLVDFIINWIVSEATKTRDRLFYLEVNAIIYCSLFENVRYLSLLEVINEEMGYTLQLAVFAAVDVLCIFISKSEILTFIWFNSNWLEKASRTWLLASRVTRACVTVTTLSWPIWNIGFELGRFIMKPDRNSAEFAKKIELVLAINYIPELLSEIALYIYLKCIPSGKYEHGRVSYIAYLRTSLHLASYSAIPSIFIGLKILIDRSRTG